MVGVSGDFQCLGMIILVDVRKCLYVPFRALKNIPEMIESRTILGSLRTITEYIVV